jgi:hypothetical protein
MGAEKELLYLAGDLKVYYHDMEDLVYLIHAYLKDDEYEEALEYIEKLDEMLKLFVETFNKLKEMVKSRVEEGKKP